MGVNTVHLHPGYDPVAHVYRAHNENTNDWYVWMVTSDGGGYAPATASAKADRSSGGTSVGASGNPSSGGAAVADNSRSAPVAPAVNEARYQSSPGGWSNPAVTSKPVPEAVSAGDRDLGAKMRQSDPAPPLPSGGRWVKEEPPEKPEEVEQEMEAIEQSPADVVIVINAAGQEEDEAQVAEENSMDAQADANDAAANASDDAAAASDSASDAASTGDAASGDSSSGGDSGGGDGGGGD